MSSTRKYRAIQLPASMLANVEKLMDEHDELGFYSLADFIKTAIREKLENYKYDLDLPRDKKK